ncbi:tRNA (cytidine(34)-2'-O)-methyltransferase [Methylococcus sp. EFPC2]|uniref:tRNA (cytidine(34)-2'-O)-methyltransferase n=1 Tax=Methylococcus sp. EFPC2 TaxID=2812648 RepID=UPI001967EC52|nr:tRNA (cytidine(34)-2'-O)-methyltransferase [Methylococcus sp. EFPC2]QSA95603.1 tRNA (cytidine(34)-2'-O)-methyltransferase [Methylococcus sp. EFPC2]
MIHILLYEPEIPPNTGNIIRLCANTGASLHLIKPLGFELDDAKLRRAGLDYREWASMRVHENLDACLDAVRPRATYAFSTKGKRCYADARFQAGDALLFGPESRGLPDIVRARFDRDHLLTIPMVPESRSLNLSNTVALALFEAWRQCGFAGATGCPPAR